MAVWGGPSTPALAIPHITSRRRWHGARARIRRYASRPDSDSRRTARVHYSALATRTRSAASVMRCATCFEVEWKTRVAVVAALLWIGFGPAGQACRSRLDSTGE